jgi:hypothetical protein
MPRIPFDQLPPDARLWIFAASRPLSDEERRRVLAEADAFIEQWTAHGVSLTAGRDVRYDRFVFIGVDEQAAGVSGCSIDALTRRMQQLQAALGVELVNNAPVVYRDGEAIERVSREQFAGFAASGTVSLDTLVFDNTVTRVGDVREGRWEVRAANAWHARAFF